MPLSVSRRCTSEALSFTGALKFAVGEPWEVFGMAGDAEIEIDLVVIRFDIGIGDGPVLTVAIAIFGFEIVIGKTQRQAAPDVCLAADGARARTQA